MNKHLDKVVYQKNGKPRLVVNGKNGSMKLGNLVQMWPTPSTVDAEGGLRNNPKRNMQQKLKDEVLMRMYPTPRANETSQGQYQMSNGKKVLTLTGVVKNFPTPLSRDWKWGGIKKDRLPDAVGAPTTLTGRLSPIFDCWLMGIPSGWTMPSTKSLLVWWESKKRRKSPGKSGRRE